MRRPRTRALHAVLGVALGAAMVLAASGCGVAANDVAATVGPTTISASLVNDLAASSAFMGAMSQQALTDQREGVVDGDAARQVLAFLVQKEVVAQEAQRWGAEVSAADRSAAAKMIEEQAPRLKGDQRDLVAAFLADRDALQARLAQLDASDDAVLRRFYDGVPGYWDRVCMDAVVVRASSVDDAQRRLDRGADLVDLPDDVRGVQVAASKATCLPATALPLALRLRLASSPARVVVGPVEGVFPGDDSVLWFRVSSSRRLSFDDAREELAQLASSIVQRGVAQWLTLRANEIVTVDPRYGSSVNVGQQGLTVVPPAVPLGAALATGDAGAADSGTP